MLLQVGYIVTSCLLNENHDFLRMVINTVRNDIIGRNETFQCLALTMVLLWPTMLLSFYSYAISFHGSLAILNLETPSLSSDNLRYCMETSVTFNPVNLQVYI